jgi:hypothetical protein
VHAAIRCNGGEGRSRALRCRIVGAAAGRGSATARDDDGRGQ